MEPKIIISVEDGVQQGTPGAQQAPSTIGPSLDLGEQKLSEEMSRLAEDMEKSGNVASGEGASTIGMPSLPTGAAVEGVEASGSGLATGLLGVGAAVAGVILVFDGLIEAGKRLINYFSQEADRLEQFSGQIGAAKGQAELRETMQDIREASAMENSLARLVDAQSRFEIALRETTLPIKEKLAELAAFLMEQLTNLVQFVRKILDGVGYFLDVAAMILENIPVIGAVMAGMAKSLAEMAHEMAKSNADVDDGDFVFEFLDSLERGIDMARRKVPIGPAANPVGGAAQ